MTRDERALSASLEQSASVLTAAGFPKMAARVLMALLIAQAEGATALQLADQLGASAAAISGAVRYLQTVGLVRRTAVARSRRDRYEVLEDAWYSVVMANSSLYTVLASLADQTVAALGDTDENAAAVERVSEMAAFFRFLLTRMPQVMEEWEQLRTRR